MAAQTLNAATMPLPFEQQPRESAKAFAAFKIYLELGPERSLPAVAEKCKKHVSIMGRWSSRWHWAERIAAHAAHLAAVERQAIEGLAVEKAVEWNKVHEAVKIAEWQRHKKLIALADDMLERWGKNKAKYGTLEGIARVLELATKLARLAAGMPTEIKEVSGEFKATLSVEWETALKKVYGKAKPVAVVDVEEVKSQPTALPAPAEEGAKP